MGIERYNLIKSKMIKQAIEKYNHTQSTLGRVADSMEIEMDKGKNSARSIFIDKMKNKLAEQEKEVAEWMHDNYEQIAKGENWNTQEICKVDFDSLPKENQNVMLELAKRILSSN